MPLGLAAAVGRPEFGLGLALPQDLGAGDVAEILFVGVDRRGEGAQAGEGDDDLSEGVFGARPVKRFLWPWLRPL